MAANKAYPSVNGDECSWVDLALNINIPGGQALDLVDVEALKFSGKLDTAASRGLSGGREMKETGGSASYEASITLTRDGDAVLTELLEIAAVAQGNVRGNEVIITGVRFDMLVQHTPLGRVQPFETKLIGCRYRGFSNDNKQGVDPDLIEIPINPNRILRKSKSGKWLALR